MRLIISLLWLVAQVVSANELLDLDARAEGDMTLGKNLVVLVDEATKEKYLSVPGADLSRSGTLEFPVELVNTFEISFKYRVLSLDQWFKVKLMDGENTAFVLNLETAVSDEWSEVKFDLQARQGDVIFSTMSARQSLTPYEFNSLKMVGSGNMIKVFLNEVFIEKIAVPVKGAYTQLSFGDIRNSYRLYEIHVENGLETDWMPSAGCVYASFDPLKGELFIPLVMVATERYEVYLQKQPLTFSFDLDMTRIQTVK